MSGLWTPGGEHPVPDDDDDDLDVDDDELEAAVAGELAEARRRVAETPVELVLANHVMACFELAAIHLSRQPPAFEPAQLAIDAMGGLLDALRGRLGSDEDTLQAALAQIRLTYVQLKAAA